MDLVAPSPVLASLVGPVVARSREQAPAAGLLGSVTLPGRSEARKDTR